MVGVEGLEPPMLQRAPGLRPGRATSCPNTPDTWRRGRESNAQAPRVRPASNGIGLPHAEPLRTFMTPPARRQAIEFFESESPGVHKRSIRKSLAYVAHQRDRLEFSGERCSTDILKRDRKLILLPFHIDRVEHVARAIEREPGHVVLHDLLDTRHHLIHLPDLKRTAHKVAVAARVERTSPEGTSRLERDGLPTCPTLPLAVGAGLEPGHASRREPRLRRGAIPFRSPYRLNELAETIRFERMVPFKGTPR